MQGENGEKSEDSWNYPSLPLHLSTLPTTILTLLPSRPLPPVTTTSRLEFSICLYLFFFFFFFLERKTFNVSQIEAASHLASNQGELQDHSWVPNAHAQRRWALLYEQQQKKITFVCAYTQTAGTLNQGQAYYSQNAYFFWILLSLA